MSRTLTGWNFWGTRGSRGTEAPARQPGTRVNPLQRAGPIRVRAEIPSVTRKRAFLNHAAVGPEEAGALEIGAASDGQGQPEDAVESADQCDSYCSRHRSGAGIGASRRIGVRVRERSGCGRGRERRRFDMGSLLRSVPTSIIRGQGLPSYFCYPSFFQPLDLHLEPADLLVKLGLDRLALVVVVAAAVAEQRFDAVQELLLPFADLDGVNLESS